MSLAKSLTKATTLGPNQGFRPNNYSMAHTPCCRIRSRECTFLWEVETEASTSCQRKVSKLSLSGSVSASSFETWGGGGCICVFERGSDSGLPPPPPVRAAKTGDKFIVPDRGIYVVDSGIGLTLFLQSGTMNLATGSKQ
jgi:hypothetical protein